MSYQIDHLFVLSAGHEEARSRLAEAGFSVAPRRDHPGQGTANHCVHLENGYLEILWVADPDEAASDITLPTGLDARSHWRDSAASPIGIALRADDDSASAVPFPYVPYRPSFMPATSAILINDDSVERGAPLVFVLPPDLPGHQAESDHASGARAITSIVVSATVSPSMSPALTMLQEHGLCQTKVAMAPNLLLELDHGRQNKKLDLGPETPLTLRW